MLPWWIFRATFLIVLIATKAFHFRQSPFSVIETWDYCIVGCDTHHLIPLSCGLLTSNITQLPYTQVCCQGTDEYSSTTSGAMIDPAHDCPLSNQAFILIYNFSSYYALSITWSLWWRILRHATLPVRFPFSDKSGDDRLRFYRLIFYLLFSQNRFSISHGRQMSRPYGRAYTSYIK